MKKQIAVFLAACVLLCFLPLFAGAQAEENEISLHINSNIAGCTRADAEKLLEIRSGPVDYFKENGYAVFIENCAGGGEHAHMDAGRTYVITYTLAAVDGYTLPQSLSDGDVSFVYGKGVSNVACKIVELPNTDPSPVPGEAKTMRVLQLTAKVVVDGTPVQRVIGWLKDLFLMLRSRSLL